MDFANQLAGLNQFIAASFGADANLESLLGSLGFDSTQLGALRERHLPAITSGFIEAIRKRLTWEDRDLWFRLVARRFGLDGDPAASLEATASLLGLNPPQASYALSQALERCRSKTARQLFERELHRVALDELAKSGARPDRDAVAQKLERLANLRAAADIARIDYEAKRAEVLKKVQTELDAIDLEFQPVLEAAEANASALEAEIRNDVLLRGESLRGSAYQAIYMKGRVSWDSAGINDYAHSHPEVLQFRREGPPSVSLRKSG
jgi:uncharacterized protein YhaN